MPSVTERMFAAAREQHRQSRARADMDEHVDSTLALVADDGAVVVELPRRPS